MEIDKRAGLAGVASKAVIVIPDFVMVAVAFIAAVFTR